MVNWFWLFKTIGTIEPLSLNSKGLFPSISSNVALPKSWQLTSKLEITTNWGDEGFVVISEVNVSEKQPLLSVAINE